MYLTPFPWSIIFVSILNSKLEQLPKQALSSSTNQWMREAHQISVLKFYVGFDTLAAHIGEHNNKPKT